MGEQLEKWYDKILSLTLTEQNKTVKFTKYKVSLNNIPLSTWAFRSGQKPLVESKIHFLVTKIKTKALLLV